MEHWPAQWPPTDLKTAATSSFAYNPQKWRVHLEKENKRTKWLEFLRQRMVSRKFYPPAPKGMFRAFNPSGNATLFLLDNGTISCFRRSDLLTLTWPLTHWTLMMKRRERRPKIMTLYYGMLVDLLVWRVGNISEYRMYCKTRILQQMQVEV